MPFMTAEFILDRLEVIGGSAGERESGNETAGRMFDYLESHKADNECAIKSALEVWRSAEFPFKRWAADYLLRELHLHADTPSA